MANRKQWSREELLVAGLLYCRIPFGRFHSSNPELAQVAHALGRTPSALAMKLSNLASVDPTFRSSGRSGLSGASANDRKLWVEMEGDWPKFALEAEMAYDRLMAVSCTSEREREPEVAVEPPDYTGGERAVTRRERVGQRLFRDAVLSAYDFRCCITGLAVPELLNASHIVPWRDDPENRLNPANGLCLSAIHDRAFDKGLITIRDDLTVAVSRGVAEHAGEFFQASLGVFDGQLIAAPEKFSPAPDLLVRHREEIFRG